MAHGGFIGPVNAGRQAGRQDVKICNSLYYYTIAHGWSDGGSKDEEKKKTSQFIYLP